MGKARELRNRRTVKRHEIHVVDWPEEDGSPYVMWARPLTCHEYREIQKKYPNFLEDQDIAGMVDLICMKAEDANGDKLFPLSEDRLDLMGEELLVVAKIAEQLMGTVQSAEVAEKNS